MRRVPLVGAVLAVVLAAVGGIAYAGHSAQVQACEAKGGWLCGMEGMTEAIVATVSLAAAASIVLAFAVYGFVAAWRRPDQGQG